MTGKDPSMDSGDVWKRWMAARDSLPQAAAPVADRPASPHNSGVKDGVRPSNGSNGNGDDEDYFAVDEESDPIDLAPIVGAPRTEEPRRRPAPPRTPEMPPPQPEILPVAVPYRSAFAPDETPAFRHMLPMMEREPWWRRKMYGLIA